MVFLLAAALGGCAHYEIVGYYAGWKPEAIFDARELTVVNYAFGYVGPDGALVLGGGPGEPATLARLVAAKRRNPDLRLMISVGGWTRSDRFSDMAADAFRRAAFIRSGIAFLREHRFDGIDIDWEYPGDIGNGCPPERPCERPGDKRNFIALGRELRAALDEAGRADGKRYLVTIAAGADDKFLRDGEGGATWLRELAEYLDWINLMSYDFHGSWERVAGLNAPLHRDATDPIGTNAEASVARLIASGIAPSKITLGLPFYGKGWAGCTPGPGNDGLYQPCAGLANGSANESFDFSFLADRGYLAQDGQGRYTIAGRGFTRHWNSAAAVPYLFDRATGTFITYDDEASIAAKLALVKRLRLRGAMYWELGADRHGVLRGVVSRGLR